MLPCHVNWEDEVRSGTLLISSSDSGSPIKTRFLKALHGFLPAAYGLQSLIRHGLSLTIVPELDHEWVALLCQQVPYLLIVDLDHTHFDALISDDCLPLVEPPEYFLHWREIETGAVVPPADHCIGLTRTRLSVSHDTRVVAVEATRHQVLYFLLDSILTVTRIKYSIKLELLRLICLLIHYR